MSYHDSSTAVVVYASRKLGAPGRRQMRTPGSSSAGMTIPHGSKALQALSHVILHEDGTCCGTFRNEHDILDFNWPYIASFTDLEHEAAGREGR